MAWWEQLWILQILAPIIVALAVGALFYYLSHREKVELKYANMIARLLETDGTINGITVECSFSLLYSKGTRERYISETRLELDNQVWKKLRSYFDKLPRWIGGIPCAEGLKELKLGKPETFGIDTSSKTSRAITDEEREELDNLVQELWHRYRIGWTDTYRKKIRWKTINQLKEFQKRGVI